MKRTTITVNESLLLEAQQMAASKGITVTALIHEALQDYIARHWLQRNLSFIGVGHSGDCDPVDAESGWEETVLAAAANPLVG